MHRFAHDAHLRPPDLHGYVVHWITPGDRTKTLQFHERILPQSMADDMARMYRNAGMVAGIQPVICRGFGAALAKLSQSPTSPIELQIVGVSADN